MNWSASTAPSATASRRAFLARPELTLEWLSASSGVTTAMDRAVVPDDRSWQLVLDVEFEACRQPGYLDAGTHLIAAVRRRDNGAATLAAATD